MIDASSPNLGAPRPAHRRAPRQKTPRAPKASEAKAWKRSSESLACEHASSEATKTCLAPEPMVRLQIVVFASQAAVAALVWLHCSTWSQCLLSMRSIGA